MIRNAVWLLGFASLIFAQRADFRVGPVVAAPGKSASGMIPIAKGVDAGTEVPVTVVHGAQPGPVLALIAGNHGYEYTPILALQQLKPLLNPQAIRGTVILVHIANMPSFLGRTIYFSPVDNKNLNRVYPGNPNGTVSERIAHAITKEVIEKSDVVFDLHCGDGNESLRPYVYQSVTGNKKLDDAMAELALAFGLEHIVLDRDRPTDPAKSLYCSTTATTRGKPALTVESGFMGLSDPKSVEAIVAGAQSTMRHLKMMDGAPLRVRNPIYLDPVKVIESPATGIFYPRVQKDQKVSEGELLAYVTDYHGNRIGDVKAPFAGIVLYIIGTPPIIKGQPAAFVGKPSR
jgi:uncharacterized protein